MYRIKKKKILIALLISAAILIGAAAAWDQLSDYSIALKANWEFSLPSEARCSEAYSKDSGSSPHGDGIRYHVFVCKNADPVDEMFAWQTAERETVYHSSYSAAADEWFGKIDVPQKERPDYEKCSYWYQSQSDNSEIIVFWNKEQSKLYVIESFL